MNRPFIDRLPLIAAALLLSGKVSAPYDQQAQADIHFDTHMAVMDALTDDTTIDADQPGFPSMGTFDELVFSQEPDETNQFSEDPVDPSAVHEEPFLPSERRKRTHPPKNQDFDASCPPPPPTLFPDLTLYTRDTGGINIMHEENPYDDDCDGSTMYESTRIT